MEKQVWRQAAKVALMCVCAAIVHIGSPSLYFAAIKRCATANQFYHDRLMCRTVLDKDSVRELLASHSSSVLPSVFQALYPLSVAINGETVVVACSGRQYVDSNQVLRSESHLLRFDCQSGHCSLLPADAGTRHVVAVGSIVQSVNDPTFALGKAPPFVMNNRITGCGEVIRSPGSPYMRLLEFRDGAWHSTESFIPVPVENMDLVRVREGTAGLDVICTASDELFYCCNVRLLSSDDLIRDNSEVEESVNTGGYVRIQLTEDSQFPFEAWMSGGNPCAVTIGSNGVVISHFGSDGVHQAVVRLPIPWDESEHIRRTHGGSLNVVRGQGEELFIVSMNGIDGRIHVVKYDTSGARVIAARGSPVIAVALMDACLLMFVVIAVPSIVSAAIAHCLNTRKVGAGDLPPVCGSIFRRCCARSVDFGIVAAFMLAAVLSHPDAMGWWNSVVPHLDEAFWSIIDVRPSVATWLSAVSAIRAATIAIAQAPVSSIWWWASIITWFSLAAMQGKTGYTLGKYLMGLRTVRVGGALCGVWHSLLKECLIVLDWPCFVTCAPWLLSVLLTHRSQGITDVLAGTTVVRSRKSGVAKLFVGPDLKNPVHPTVDASSASNCSYVDDTDK